MKQGLQKAEVDNRAKHSGREHRKMLITYTNEANTEQVEPIRKDNKASDTWRKGEWPKTREEILFKIKQEVERQKAQPEVFSRNTATMPDRCAAVAAEKVANCKPNSQVKSQ